MNDRYLLDKIIKNYEVKFDMEAMLPTAKFRLDLDKIMTELLNIVYTFEDVQEIELYVGSSKFTGKKQYKEVTRKEMKESVLIKEE